MSIIVSVKIHDGVVMAADSATTFVRPSGQAGQIYQNANKIVNLIKGLPIGVMTCGSGGVGPASIATLLKDLRARMTGEDPDWLVDPRQYTIEQVTGLVHKFFSERATENDFKAYLMLRICGYSSGRPLPEIWETVFTHLRCAEAGPVRSWYWADMGGRVRGFEPPDPGR